MDRSTASMKDIKCRCCGTPLSSGRLFYPQGNEDFVCQYCRPPVLKIEKPVEIYVEADEFTGFVPVKYVEQVDVT